MRWGFGGEAPDVGGAEQIITNKLLMATTPSVFIVKHSERARLGERKKISSQEYGCSLLLWVVLCMREDAADENLSGQLLF